MRRLLSTPPRLRHLPLPAAAAALAMALGLGASCSSKPAAQSAGTTAGTGGAHTSSSGTGGSGGFGGNGADVPCTASGVSKGPWSFAVDGTSAKLRWEACSASSVGTVVYAPETGGANATAESTVSPYTTMTTYTAALDPSATPDYAGTWYIHDVALTGLTPATCYVYHLAADAKRAGRFCTARPSGSALTFMSIGDTNPGIGPYAAGDLMYALPHHPDFTIHGGDIQYYDSLLETWASWFPVMQPMLSAGGFYPAIGNHEAEEPDEYVAYTERFFGGPGFDGVSEYYRFQSAGVWFFSLDTELPLDPGSAQGGWLIQELADATTQPGFRFSIVYMHRPLVTCGDTDDNPELRALLEPYFIQYHVPIVIQAHMHGYERFEFGDITYLTIAGGGGAIGNPSANTQRSYCNQRVVAGGFRHAAIFDLGTGKISGTIIDYTGIIDDSFTETVP